MKLLRHINTWYGACYSFQRVACSDIPSLPDITIRLHGQNVTLTGENYARKLETPKDCVQFGDEDQCYLLILFLGGVEDLIILMPFLESVMGVWNWDGKTISCELIFICLFFGLSGVLQLLTGVLVGNVKK